MLSMLERYRTMMVPVVLEQLNRALPNMQDQTRAIASQFTTLNTYIRFLTDTSFFLQWLRLYERLYWRNAFLCSIGLILSCANFSSIHARTLRFDVYRVHRNGDRRKEDLSSRARHYRGAVKNRLDTRRIKTLVAGKEPRWGKSTGRSSNTCGVPLVFSSDKAPCLGTCLGSWPAVLLREYVT